MNQFGLAFHHFGLAVRNPAASFLYLQALGYREGRTCFDPHQRVNLSMRHHAEMPDVEVIWPGNLPSPIDKMLKSADGRLWPRFLGQISLRLGGSVCRVDDGRLLPSLRQLLVQAQSGA
jgi:hypothetical protein